MTTTDRGARLRAVKLAGAAAAALALPSTQASAADPPSPRATALRAPVAGHLTVAGQMRAAARTYEQRRLMRVADELGRRAHVPVSRSRLRGDSPAMLRTRIARLRRELRTQRTSVSPARRDAPSSRSPSATLHALQAIAACESGGDPRAIGGGGLYRGKYQFSLETWASVGGSGDPAAAPEAEQDKRAAMLYARAGATPWPVCGG
jgi:hypothetical protein